MPSIPRRHLLAATGSLSAAIAGCADSFGTDESMESTDNATEGSDPIPSDEFDVLTRRSAEDSIFVYPADEPPGSDDHSQLHGRSTEFVLTAEDAAALTIDAADTDEVRSFLDATDFDTESIVVEQRSIDDCDRRHLLSVQARPDEFRTQYCRRLKAATTPCTADLTVMKAVFIRIQQAYDEPPSRRSSSEGTSCPDWVFDDDRSAPRSDADDSSASEKQPTEGTDA